MNKKKKKHFLWYLISMVSLLGILIILLPVVSADSETEGEKKEWDLRGLYYETKHLGEIAEDDLFSEKEETEEEEKTSISSAFAEIDVGGVRTQIKKAQQILLLICGALLVMGVVNLLCMFFTLGPPGIFSYITVVVTCIIDVGTVILIRAACGLQVRALSNILEPLEDLGWRYQVDFSDVTILAKVHLGYGTLLLLGVAVIMLLLLLIVRSKER